MTGDDLAYATIGELGAALRSGAITSVALTEALLARCRAYDEALNAFITLTPELALAQADQADRELAQGRDRGALQGIPIALKDLIATAGIRTTGGSRLNADWLPTADATVVTRLKAAGAVLIGKTGLHELAYGVTSINPHFGAIANPWKTDHHPGGSSGGSAAAVAAGLVPAALGSDTGCSIRQPAAFCGIVGLKPSFGLVSKAGVLPLVWTMDHVGPMTRCVRDAALVLAAIAGPDPDDPHSASPPPSDYLSRLEAGVEGLRIGVPQHFFYRGGDPEVVALVEAALAQFEALGAKRVDVEIPEIDQAFADAATTFAEAAAIHRDDLAARPEAYSRELQSKLAHSARHSAADYAAAQQRRRIFTQRVEREVLRQCDLLATPTANVTAAPIDALPENHGHFCWRNTSIFDFTGQPSISLPCGLSSAGLPVGLMLSARLWDEARLLGAARAYERANDWQRLRPPLAY